MMQSDRTTGKLVKVNKMGEEMHASLVIDGARQTSCQEERHDNRFLSQLATRLLALNIWLAR